MSLFQDVFTPSALQTLQFENNKQPGLYGVHQAATIHIHVRSAATFFLVRHRQAYPDAQGTRRRH